MSNINNKDVFFGARMLAPIFNILPKVVDSICIKYIEGDPTKFFSYYFVCMGINYNITSIGASNDENNSS